MVKNQTLYRYMNQTIGISSHDNHTFILFRRSSQIVRKYNAIGLSTTILLDLIKKGCRIIIVKINGDPKYKISPREWMEKGIKDRLYPTQDLHSFLPLNKFEEF